MLWKGLSPMRSIRAYSGDEHVHGNKSEEGSVTVEAALALLSLMVVSAAIISACMTMAAHIAAVHTAGAAARAHAIGLDYSPTKGRVSISEDDTWVHVHVEIPSIWGQAQAQAHYPKEDKDE